MSNSGTARTRSFLTFHADQVRCSRLLLPSPPLDDKMEKHPSVSDKTHTLVKITMIEKTTVLCIFTSLKLGGSMFEFGVRFDSSRLSRTSWKSIQTSEGRYSRRTMTFRWVIPPFFLFFSAWAYVASSLFDRRAGQGWKDVQVLDLQTCSRPALRGIRPETVSLPPCPANTRQSSPA